MSSTRTWILSAALSTGLFSLLPIGAAQAQESSGVDVTLQSATVDPQTGEVTISGTVTCAEATTAQVYANLTQPVGREGAVHGSYYAYVPCDQDGEPYSISLFGYDGRFGPGRAVAALDAYACGFEFCDDAHLQQSIRLARR